MQNLNYLEVADVEIIQGDVTDVGSIYGAFEVCEPDEVYNLAAQSFVRASFDCPASTFDINAVGVINLLEVVRHIYPDTKVYQASTSEMFGLVNVEAQNEETPLYPRSPYGVSKVAAHHAVRNYREAYGLHASCGILFNHESPIRGLEFVTRKITDGVAQILAGKTDSLTLGNLTPRRDWGFAGDYVKAMHLMLQQDTPDDYVIATGEAFSVEQLVWLAFKMAGLNWKDYVQLDPSALRPTDVPLLCGDASKAKNVLGWKPETKFDEMLSLMLDADIERHATWGNADAN